jgi:exonuclease III
VNISENVFAINHLKKKNLERVQGKQDDQVFTSNLRIKVNNIVKNVLLALNYYDGNINEWLTKLGDRSYLNLKRIRINIKSRKNNFDSNKLKVKSHGIRKRIQLKDKFVRHRQIELQLRKDGVHPNPGPKGAKFKQMDLSFMTYNCRGLRESNKLKRLLAKLNTLVNRNYIIALQETHKVDEDLLSKYWKYKYISNCNKTNKGGVILLFGNDYNVNFSFKDIEDRLILAEIESEKYKLIVGNVYFPNDHKEAIKFSETLYAKVLEFQYRSADSYTCVMGDMNHCLSTEDSVNRKEVAVEKELAKLTKINNDSCELVDGYRHLEKKGGYTWSRGECFSRLDYIFISDELKSKIRKVEIEWCMEKSDHAAVVCNLRIQNNIEKGPGIVKLNANLLNKDETKNEIKVQLRELLNQIPVEWNPHTKLEYAKMAIRTVFSNVGGSSNRERNSQIKEVEEQINRNNQIREKEMLKNKLEVNDNLIVMIKEANSELSLELDKLREKHSDDLAFKSGVRWYEEGEKSNKYFLGLLKKRSSQKVISEISDNGEIHRNQSGITNCIKEFYERLYKKSDKKRKEDKDFFKLCPKLSRESREFLDKEIKLEELGRTLKDCKESAPGPDGITYNIYKELWEMVGPIILNSWNFSVETGIMPPSHLESTLTLLPKEGKDSKEIKNWRPITLSNCDAKIITKTLANRMSKHMDSIIDTAQTAYIPGRSVMDNMRSNMFIKNYCNKNKVGGAIVALDAKKAFDSVSHQYILEVLDAYGVGEVFKTYFKVLYNKIDVRVLVNGYFSDKIKIERGVKQGDALSCSLFILCMDPLIRNINANMKIEGINIRGTKSTYKASGYADDIAVICKNNWESIQGIFAEYDRLTNLSGLELNAEKTELLQIGKVNGANEMHEVRYGGLKYVVKTVEKIKICGIVYCTEYSEEYDSNILEKIEKLETQLKRWMCRNLTLEGKILIVKTFGLSQLIYNLQCYEIIERDIKVVERMIFKFIWCKDWNRERWNERISRKVLKNEYEKGGLRAPDVECLNRALKLKQFIRASNGNHVIRELQLSEGNLKWQGIQQEYQNPSSIESVVHNAQSSINILTDRFREEICESIVLRESSSIVINMMGSIDIATYLGRKKELLAKCWYNQIKEEGIDALGDLLQEIELTNDNNKITKLKRIENTFPKEIVEAANNFASEINEKVGLTHFYLGNEVFVPAGEITVKQIQVLLKQCLNKIAITNFDEKLAITGFNIESITEVRRQVQNVQLRNIFYRLINKDFFTKERMLRYKMVENNRCEKCDEPETFKHLMWECRYVRRSWSNLNRILRSKGEGVDEIRTYDEIFRFNNSAAITAIKLKIIQHFIQINRQTDISEDKIYKIINDLIAKEKYIAMKNRRIKMFLLKWKHFI